MPSPPHPLPNAYVEDPTPNMIIAFGAGAFGRQCRLDAVIKVGPSCLCKTSEKEEAEREEAIWAPRKMAATYESREDLRMKYTLIVP